MAQGQEYAFRGEGGLQYLEKRAYRDQYCIECAGGIPKFEAIYRLPDSILVGSFLGNQKFSTTWLRMRHEDFRIQFESVAEGARDTNLIINGFRSQYCNWDDWGAQLPGCREGDRCIGVRWASKGSDALMADLDKFMTSNVPFPLNLLRLLDNDWTDAVANSGQAAMQLALSIRAARKSRPINLIGHSLGGRVAVRTLDVYSRREPCYVNDVVLLGAAAAQVDSRWKRRRRRVSGRFVNVYSRSDAVLNMAFRVGSVTATAAGSAPLCVPGIIDVDVTDIVGEGFGSHFKFVNNLTAILQRVDAVAGDA